MSPEPAERGLGASWGLAALAAVGVGVVLVRVTAGA